MAMQEETKFSNLPDFARALSRLRKAVDADYATAFALPRKKSLLPSSG
jgi:DNA topoisomerase IB